MAIREGGKINIVFFNGEGLKERRKIMGAKGRAVRNCLFKKSSGIW